MQETHHIKNLEDLKSWVHKWSSSLKDKELILLNGDLGAGKTQLVSFLLENICEEGEVSSPTFTIHNVYKTKQSTVDHVDLYRIENEEDLESTGFWDLFSKDKGWIIVEWASKIQEEHWPTHWPKQKVLLKKENDTERTLILEK